MTLPTLLDIEASGFGRGSYPIEVGLARADGSVCAFLIQPQNEWTHWDPKAELLHGISRSRLERELRDLGLKVRAESEMVREAMAASNHQLLSAQQLAAEGSTEREAAERERVGAEQATRALVEQRL